MAKRAACLGALRDAPGHGSGSSVFACAVARPLGGFAMMALRMGAPCPAGAGRETPLTRPVLLRQTRSARRFPGRPVRLLLGAGTAGAVLLSRAVPATPGRSQACRVSRGGQAGPRCPLRPNRRVLSPTPFRPTAYTRTVETARCGASNSRRPAGSRFPRGACLEARSHRGLPGSLSPTR